MEDNIKQKTGKSVTHWIEVLQQSRLQKHSEMVKYLKSEHNFTHGYANFVALKTRRSDAGSIDDAELLAAQYKGKEDLRPLYDFLLEHIRALGTDIVIVPKKANVSIRRKVQFALIQPSTKSRIDLGLKIKSKSPLGRLENSGPFGAMCTHRIRLEHSTDVDEEILDYIRQAYEQAG